MAACSNAALRAYAQREVVARAEAAEAAGEGGATSESSAAFVEAPYIGKRVTISGLKARPDLNGQNGEARVRRAPPPSRVWARVWAVDSTGRRATQHGTARDTARDGA